MKCRLNSCLVCSQLKALSFGKSSIFPLFIFGIGFEGNTTKSTNSVILSYWSFCKGSSRDGEPKGAHHFCVITVMTVKRQTKTIVVRMTCSLCLPHTYFECLHMYETL
nr:hypothetical protein CFP56_29788 [Quercus suber]